MKNYADSGGGVIHQSLQPLGRVRWIRIKYFFFSFSFRILMQQKNPYQTTSVMYNAFKNLPALQDL